MAKDWIGNYKSVYSVLGATNHSRGGREENDYYATDPKAVDILLQQETFSPIVWECACGEGHISKALEKAGYAVISTDLIYRGYGRIEPLDFLKDDIPDFPGDIITNPPYKYAQEFVERAMQIVHDGHKVAMLLKLTFLEGKARKQMYMEYPPQTVYVFSERIKCAKNGEFDKIGSSAVAYAWFVWRKGFHGSPAIKWIN